MSYPRSPDQGRGGGGAVGRCAAILQKGEYKTERSPGGCPPPGEVAEERAGLRRVCGICLGCNACQQTPWRASGRLGAVAVWVPGESGKNRSAGGRMRTSFLFMASSPLKVYFYVCLMMYIKLGRQHLFIIINKRSLGCVHNPVCGPSILVGRAIQSPAPRRPRRGAGPCHRREGPRWQHGRPGSVTVGRRLLLPRS